MASAQERREAEYKRKIRQALHDKKLVIIVGAGITLNATHPSPSRITWTGLVLDGLDYLKDEGFIAAEDEDLNYHRRVLQRDNTDIRNVLRVCSYLKDELGHHTQYPTWLKSVFGSLHGDVTRPEIYEALREFHQKGARLMTTNYDELLEHYCNLQRVRRSIPEDIRKYEQGTLDGVFHVHGSFQDPKEVVLDPIGYYQVKTSDDVQNLLKTYLGHNTILFVGCGSGLEDPNFNALLEWASNREENIPNHHYLLVRDGDNLRYNPLITLKYGWNHEDLVPYLNALLEDPADAFPTGELHGKKASVEKAFKGKGSFPKKQEYREALLNSLEFDHIEDRYNNIKVAHSETCKWLLTNKNYKSWLDKNRISHHHGLLWLKGKPGAGKSTIVKFALSEAKRSRKEDIHISFFFNARGSSLEKDTLGMYQSLLFQLFTKLPNAQEVFDDFDVLELPRAPRYSWTIIQLQNVLDRAIHELGTRRLWMFVDALDECDENQIRDMVKFFDLLGKQAVTSDINMRVFFASRYYPKITTPKKVELRLEDEEEHSRDIERYIQSELRTGNNTQSTAVQRIREEVKRRASGVFIWVVLVVQILNKAYNHGRITSLEKKLQEIPDDLGELFKGILTRDGQNMEDMRLCIQWILFAERPLSREELYFAILSGTDPEKVGPWEHEETTTEVMDAFILSSSKGLAELTQSESTSVQFIHETIRDFLLKENGMQYIQGTSTQSLLGSGHNSLKHCCVNYISSTQGVFLENFGPVDFEDLDALRGTYESLVKSRQEGYHWEVQSQRQILLLRLPFIEYALSHVFYHANAAEANRVSQASFLQEFCVRPWIHLTNVVSIIVGREQFYARFRRRLYKDSLDSHIFYSLDSSLLYILAEQNWKSLIETMLRINPRVDIEGGHFGSPILTALEHMHYDALSALLTPDCSGGSADYSAPLLSTPNQSEITGLIDTYKDCYQRGTSAASVLQFFFQWGTESEVFVLLRSGRFGLDANISAAIHCSPLSFAAARGYERLVKFLLDKEDMNPDLQDDRGLTPLSKAAKEGRLIIALLLIQGKRNVDVNSRSFAGRSPLSYAAEEGHEDVLKQLLCQRDVEINLRDNKGRTPFFYAAERGHECIVKLLINSPGVNILSRDNIGHTALSYAVLHGHEGVVRQLLDTGEVDINSRDNVHGRTPLSFAFEYGYHSIASLLLNRPNIDINTRDSRGRTLFDYAQRPGREAMATLLPSLQ